MKPISQSLHAVLDYITVIALLAFPYFLLKPGSAASTFSYAVAVIQLLLSICTRYRGGLLKLIPFKTHGYIEAGMAVSFGLIALAFLSQDAGMAFAYYIALMCIYLFVFFLTDFKTQFFNKAERNS